MPFELPELGIVFWPVGTGDSTSIAVDADTIVQIDLRQLDASEEGEEPAWAVVDELVACLPKRGARPYLAAFALTHPDQDHCDGFEDLLKRVEIGELWFTPRIFLEYKKDLCSDACAFHDEARRRVDLTIKAKGGDPGDGNRVRIFGASEWLNEDDYKGFPESRLVIPGSSFSTINDTNFDGTFRAFVHAPFKDDCDDGDRNDTSLALQVGLTQGVSSLRALLLGDLTYPVLKNVFSRSDEEDLEWNILLAPHHCSKSAMFWKDAGDNDETRRQDILNQMGDAASTPSFIIASSRPVPATDKAGANPPHAKAKRCYEELTETFLCTMETPSAKQPEPITFELTEEGPHLRGEIPPAPPVSDIADRAQGGDSPPKEPTTYGADRGCRPPACS